MKKKSIFLQYLTAFKPYCANGLVFNSSGKTEQLESGKNNERCQQLLDPV